MPAVLMPDFWPTEAALWFRLLEHQFSYLNITNQSTRFAILTPYLTKEVAIQVSDVLIRPGSSALGSTLFTRHMAGETVLGVFGNDCLPLHSSSEAHRLGANCGTAAPPSSYRCTGTVRPKKVSLVWEAPFTHTFNRVQRKLRWFGHAARRPKSELPIRPRSWRKRAGDQLMA